MATTGHDSDGRDPSTPVLISEVIGEGEHAHRLVRVGDWTLAVPGADGTEPVIPDRALAERLGLPIHKLRQLSGRHERAGNITPTTVVGVWRGGRGMARAYGEADALFLVTRAETPKAVALTREMIRVYMLARRGLLPRPAAPAPEVAAIAQALAVVPQLAAQVGGLQATVKELQAEVCSGVIGAQAAAEKIEAPLARVAGLMAAHAKERRSKARSYANRLRNLLGFNGPGSKWSALPRRLLDIAERQIGLWLDEAIAATRTNPRRQPGLFADAPPKN